jgi:hypothetical protein
MGQFGFSSVNPRFGTKKSKRHKSTQKFHTKNFNGRHSVKTFALRLVGFFY